MREVTGSEQDVHRILHPSSVAVIGASARPGSLSWWPTHLMRHRGFAGALYPVNPKYSEIEGLTCFGSIAEVPTPPELAIITLSADASVDAVAQCAAAGVRSVILPSQGFGELGEEGRRKEQRLVEMAREAGIRIVGPNTDGIANIATGAVVSIQPLFEQRVDVGPIAVVAQSGATAASLIMRLQAENIGVRMSASAGNEIDLGLADFMSVMLQDPEVKMLVSFVESVRHPEHFYQVAEMAAELDKPIALIKVGRSEEGARRASAHTGALAGSDQLNDAVFAKYGVIRVTELADIVAVAKTYLGNGSYRSGGAGIISASGGQAGSAADKAASMGVGVPALSAETEHVIDELLTFGTGFNPCDLTGEIAVKPELAAEVYQQFSLNDTVGAVVYIRKKLLGDVSERCARPLVEASTRPGATPLLVFAMDGVVTGEEAQLYNEAKIPVFSSQNELYNSMAMLDARTRSLQRLRDAPSVATSRSVEPVFGGVRASDVLDERATKDLLSRYGIPIPREALVTSAEEAIEAASRIGYPVVIKVADPDIAHKTEIGGVIVGIHDEEEARLAAKTIVERASAALGGRAPHGLLVQEQIVGGVEMIAGLKVDPDFGAFVLLGSGGVAAELLKDVALRPAPVSPQEVRAMIAELTLAPMLEGYRGAPLADVEALVDVVCKVSQLGADHAFELAEADLNPLVVLPQGQGVRAVDALFVARS
jgi:acetyltransferase